MKTILPENIKIPKTILIFSQKKNKAVLNQPEFKTKSKTL